MLGGRAAEKSEGQDQNDQGKKSDLLYRRHEKNSFGVKKKIFSSNSNLFRMIKIIINWILLAAVLTVNALANILPINGMNTGEISGMYPNYFVPAGFTFGIWSIIYLLLLSYNIAYSYYRYRPGKFPEINHYLETINPLFWLTCLWNAGWILAWHYLAIILSVLIMLAFLVTLITLFHKAVPLAKGFATGTTLCLFTPFVVYFSWICVATLANITALLVSLEWTGGGLNGVYWSALLIIIAILLGLYITVRYRVPAYGAVIVWALWGIRAAQGANHPLLDWVPLCGMLLLVSAMWMGNRFRFLHKPD